MVHAPVVEEAGGAGTGTGVACATCPHAQESHDSIARRFCTATVAGGFNRQCVCVGDTTSL
ncbi:RGCVC family protein [Amycolatopsis kentuckyensis]|uniref:RGCVC family protein n=1 Tax=Amycolatopsis kentuckyensis TaxID=218823 RepID=UPI001AC0053A|nr:RGCVC family protein [Amycolatopsis kentuckyensis]